MHRLIPALLAAALAPPAWAAPAEAGGDATALALFVVLVAIVGWLALRRLLRSLGARRTERAVGEDFVEYALEVLVNAAKIDGRVNDAEKRAIVTVMRDIAGEAFKGIDVEAAFERARLTKSALVSYLAAKSRIFTRDQKAALIKALLSVFVSDGRFDENEHAALVDYTEAIGFDRQGAPDMLRAVARDVMRGSIT